MASDMTAAIGRYVNGKIMPLQRGVLAENPGAKATLARLRADIDGRGTNWMDIGNDLYGDWPTESLGDPDRNPRAVAAVSTALGLYALHQQSKTTAVAQVDTQETRSISFGAACRQIVADPDSGMNDDAAKGVVRRLSAAESAPTFEGMVWFLRALIMLMRASGRDISLDYRRFAQDLYLLQFPEYADQVFQRWSCDFYYRPASTRNTSK